MDDREAIYRPGCVHRGGEEDLHKRNEQPFRLEQTDFYPANRIGVGDDGEGFVVLLMFLDGAGLSKSISPDQARAVASGLSRAADHAESITAAQANAAIAKARGR